MNRFLKVSLITIGLLAFQLPFTISAYADWHLDNDGSSLSFVSIKKGTVVEAHTFSTLTGSVKDNGEVVIHIDLASAKTGIPIRDERLAALLFETMLHPKAVIESKIDLKNILALESGHYLLMDVEAKLSLHGVELPIELNLQIMRTSPGSFQVQSRKPIVINAASFGMEKGVEALRVIAGLSAVTASVPVSFSLNFHN